MDYKPGARREKPVEQLMLYALALSRLSGIRLFNMKCAWFDEKDYYEFFPLHVVLKKGMLARGKRLQKTGRKTPRFRENPNQMELPVGV